MKRILLTLAVLFAATTAQAQTQVKGVRYYDTAAEFTSKAPETGEDGRFAFAIDTQQMYYYSTDTSTWTPMAKHYATAVALEADTDVADGTFAYAQDTNTAYLFNGTAWTIVASSVVGQAELDFSVSFDAGASKGLALLEHDGTAYSTTAGALNDMFYKHLRFNFTTIAAATATLTPTAEATGVDLTVGAGDNDHGTIFTGTGHASGRPFIVGQDPAFFMCATFSVADVSGTDAMMCGFRDVAAPTVIGSYTDYAAVGPASGNITIYDATNTATDTTDDLANTETLEMCTYVSAAGVATYTLDIDGAGAAAPSTTAAHTIGDGVLVLPFCQVLNTADIADDTLIQSWSQGLQ